MNRASRRKISYVVAVAALGGPILYLLIHTHQPTDVFLLVALLFLIPGRIPGYFWKEFFRGNKFLGIGEMEKGIQHFEKFLAQVRQRPWLKRLMWFRFGIYTWDIEAMTQNNMGAAKLQLGRFAEAECHFHAALDLDPQYSVPYFNLALVAEVAEKEQQAKDLFEESIRLGYRKISWDEFVRKAGSMVATLEAPGTKSAKGTQ